MLRGYIYWMNWQVYIIRCTDDALYTGVTTDVERRFSRHASGKGAKFFRGREPQAVVYMESGHTHSTASKREAEIKKLSRDEKWRLLAAQSNEVDAAKANQG
jgi:putative endonuclease